MWTFIPIWLNSGSYLPEALYPLVVQLNATYAPRALTAKDITFPSGEKWSCELPQREVPAFIQHSSMLERILKGQCFSFRVLGEHQRFCSGGAVTRGVTSIGQSEKWISESEEVFSFAEHSAVLEYVCEGQSEFLYLKNHTYHYKAQSSLACAEKSLANFSCAAMTDDTWHWQVCRTSNYWNATQSREDEHFVLGEGPAVEQEAVTDQVRIQSMRRVLLDSNRRWLPSPSHLEVLLEGGSVCAATGETRTVRIWFQCDESRESQLEAVFEPYVCQYLFIVNTKDVCQLKELRWKKNTRPSPREIACSLTN